MTTKSKIVIIEDDYRQFQICRNSLQSTFDILPVATTLREFNAIKSQLMQLLKQENENFKTLLSDYNGVSAFIVDYELKEDSNKTGILFCELTDCINKGTIPVFFLTKLSDADPTNRIQNLPTTHSNIEYDYLRKPESWADESKTIDSIVNECNTFNISMKEKINRLIQSSKNTDDYDLD